MHAPQPSTTPSPAAAAGAGSSAAGRPARHHKYRASAPVDLPDRRWPSRTIERAPIWSSTDLRDGNQALFDPMDPARKQRLFDLLVKTGFKDIEVGFPSASQADFDFVRSLIEQRRVPDDVCIGVLVQARDDLIERTFEALRGAPRATVHFYTPIAPAWRRQVFGADVAAVRDRIVAAARTIHRIAARHPQTDWRFEFSPETFSAAELDVSLSVCDAVTEVWQASAERPVILNLPATVEVSTPNVYADQIEWMDRHLARRDGVILSVHPHNDRGTGVAAAELAVMAGAQRVEGCLFGNGERTGNVDLVTLAMNLHSQGIDPELDFSDIQAVVRVCEDCTQLPVHPRHPYAGDLVFTAFSGSHQDAIRKGMAARDDSMPWQVPYLPIDPADVGRSYDSVVRINSQSGKGGIAYLLESCHGVTMPRRMQVEFSAAVQRHADAEGGEIDAHALWAIFEDEYLAARTPWRVLDHRITRHDGRVQVDFRFAHGSRTIAQTGHGDGPLEALVDALARTGLAPAGIRIDGFHEQSTGSGAGARAVALVEVAIDGVPPRFGAGASPDIVAASFDAVTSALNRCIARQGGGARQDDHDGPHGPNGHNAGHDGPLVASS